MTKSGKVTLQVALTTRLGFNLNHLVLRPHNHQLMVPLCQYLSDMSYSDSYMIPLTPTLKPLEPSLHSPTFKTGFVTGITSLL